VASRFTNDDDTRPAKIGTGDTLDTEEARASRSAVREAMRESQPERFGRLQPIDTLGDGGMGQVYAARDPQLGRQVAVRVIHPHLADDDTMRERFVAEGQLTSQLEHPNIVPVYDMGETEDGTPFMVMKQIRGRSLGEVLDALREGDGETEAQWSRHRLLITFVKVCQAVAYAHTKGVLHRDLKPSNIMLGEFGEVLVLDWGVAQQVDRVPESTRRKEGAVGTPGYMSPEQVKGEAGRFDSRSDVWSLGAILYEIVTNEPAYQGDGPLELMAKSARRRPTMPALRAPAANVPQELSDLCLQALDPNQSERFASALELAEAVEAFLEGTRRRDQAAKHMERARKVWAIHQQLADYRTELLIAEKRHADAADAWAPLSEKQELLSTRTDLAELEPRRARVFGEVIAICEKALAYDPQHTDARAALARAYWTRVEEAEQRRDDTGVAYYSDRVATYDDGGFTKLLQGTGKLSLHTDPPGAEVICERYDSHSLVLPLRDRRVLGHTPLLDVSLPMGSYLLTIKHDGKRGTLYPVYISRCREWGSGAEAVALYDNETIGDDYLYVPAGPSMCGGDPDAPGSKQLHEVEVDGFFIARFPVSMAEYLEFLNALHEKDAADAWRRSPRSEAGLRASEGQYFKRPRATEQYQLPELDDDGNEWDPSWPVFGVSWHDAVTYAKWLSERDGRSYRLPLENELEKAARGADGRFYPWGDGFDRTLCKMGDSRRGRARPEPIGAFPADKSVYGVRDLAGSMRVWCGDEQFDGDGTLRAVRGGSWNYDPRFCRAACRLGRPPWRVFAYNGFRLARDIV
jgi:serine/threonine protein kinase/formylglycine-generating enzyme required for sulfatase activity